MLAVKLLIVTLNSMLTVEVCLLLQFSLEDNDISKCLNDKKCLNVKRLNPFVSKVTANERIALQCHTYLWVKNLAELEGRISS